jgi:hypothetical protein
MSRHSDQHQPAVALGTGPFTHLNGGDAELLPGGMLSPFLFPHEEKTGISQRPMLRIEGMDVALRIIHGPVVESPKEEEWRLANTLVNPDHKRLKCPRSRKSRLKNATDQQTGAQGNHGKRRRNPRSRRRARKKITVSPGGNAPTGPLARVASASNRK